VTAAKLKVEVNSYPTRGKIQEPVKVRVLSAVLTWPSGVVPQCSKEGNLNVWAAPSSW